MWDAPESRDNGDADNEGGNAAGPSLRQRVRGATRVQKGLREVGDRPHLVALDDEGETEVPVNAGRAVEPSVSFVWRRRWRCCVLRYARAYSARVTRVRRR